MSAVSKADSVMQPIPGAVSKKRSLVQDSGTSAAPRSGDHHGERRYYTYYGRHGTQRISRFVQPLLRFVLGGAFILAGILKILNPLHFAHDVENFRLLPQALSHVVAVVLPAIEVTAGGFLIAGVWLRASTLLLTGLLGVFLLAVSSALFRGLNIECGCFGTAGGRHVGLVTLAIDLVLLIIGLMLLVIPPQRLVGRRTRVAA